MATGDVVYSLRFSLIKILPESGFDLGSTAGEFCVLTARLHMLYSNGIMSTTDVFITPTIIRQALRKLKPGKEDGDCGLKSDHNLLHSTQRFHILLCLLFNTMLVHIIRLIKAGLA